MLRKTKDTVPHNDLPADAFLAITEAEELTLFSVDPEMKISTTVKPTQNRGIPDNGRKTRLQKMGIPKEQFHGHDVLGEIEITDPAEREAIAAHLKQGTFELDGWCIHRLFQSPPRAASGIQRCYL